MATVRTRTKTGTPRSGYRVSSAGVVSTTNWNDFQWGMTDVVGDRGKPHALNLEKRTVHSMITMTGVSGGQTYVNYPTTDMGTGSAHLPLPSRPSDADLAVDAIAKSNPSRPMVDVPVFVFELADLPKLVKYTGELLLKPKSQSVRDAISGLVNDPKNVDVYLAWQFGWKPLIQDVFQMLNFVSSVEKRKSELEGLYKNGGLRRRTQFQTQRASLIQNDLQVQSAGGFSVRVDRSTHTFRESWATVRWLPDVPQIRPSDRDMHAMAIRSAYGLNFSIASAWEAMPWSWLIDYFTRVGSYLETNRNAVGAHPDSVCIMTRTVTDVISKLRSKTTSMYVSGAGRYTRDTKQRVVVPPGTPASLVRVPFLSGTQWSILSSLAISKNRDIARR